MIGTVSAKEQEPQRQGRLSGQDCDHPSPRLPLTLPPFRALATAKAPHDVPELCPPHPRALDSGLHGCIQLNCLPQDASGTPILCSLMTLGWLSPLSLTKLSSLSCKNPTTSCHFPNIGMHRQSRLRANTGRRKRGRPGRPCPHSC